MSSMTTTIRHGLLESRVLTRLSAPGGYLYGMVEEILETLLKITNRLQPH
jgi:hypothetical protein